MRSSRTIAIVQARMGSTRLPGKILFPLAGIPVIIHVIQRIKKCKNIDEIIVATTLQKDDLATIKVCSQFGIRVFAGSTEDVLDRYYQAALKFKAMHIVRITGDCPLIDPFIVDKVIRYNISHQSDYSSNTMPPTYPDGLDVEIFSFKTLKRAWKNARLPSEREHVTPYIKKHKELFKLSNIQNRIDYSHFRWTLDNHEDYIFLQKFFSLFPVHTVPLAMRDIICTLENHPEFTNINAHIIRNEGYIKSLKGDKGAV